MTDDQKLPSAEAGLPWSAPPSITLPLGFTAGAVAAGIKTYGEEPRFDVGILASDRVCNVAGIFTTNRIAGAPVVLCRERVALGTARALIINSGCSNVGLGERGMRDARRMAELAASKIGSPRAQVLVGSTGVIGRPLPMQRIEDGVSKIVIRREGGEEFSRAMMTTDRVPKVRAVEFQIDGKTYRVSGTAKGSGMAHPDMATVFCFLTTDASVSSEWLQGAVKRVGDRSINMVDVDMDTSTSDMMLAFANGAVGGPALDTAPEAAQLLEQALLQVSVALAKDLARDGEGARKLIEAEVRGAKTLEQARLAARTIVSSPLIKTMVTGCDPNLGRVLMAIGRSGAELHLERLGVWIGDHHAFSNGTPTDLDLELIGGAMQQDTVRLTVDLAVGSSTATAWGCDLTEDYIRINADYTT